MNKDMKILIVDDFKTTRRIVKIMLRDMGFENLVEADDGETALPIIREGGIDFLLTDWNMPRVTGIDLVRQIRADDRFKKLPILMVTAEAHQDQIVAAAKAGIDGYIIKPFTEGILKEKIEGVLETVIKIEDDDGRYELIHKFEEELSSSENEGW